MTETQIIDMIEQETPAATPLKGFTKFRMVPLPEVPEEVETELATLLTAVGVN